MLTRRELAEMRTLVMRVQQGSVSREDWSNLAALTLVSQGDAIVAGIAAGGYDTFRATSGDIYDKHAFREDDYRRIYKRVCDAAGRLVPEWVPTGVS